MLEITNDPGNANQVDHKYHYQPNENGNIKKAKYEKCWQDYPAAEDVS